MVFDWYGLDAGWFYPLERSARRRYRRKLTVEHRPTVLIYRLRGLDVPGDGKLTIAFHRHPPYDTYGRKAEDSPSSYSTAPSH